MWQRKKGHFAPAGVEDGGEGDKPRSTVGSEMPRVTPLGLKETGTLALRAKEQRSSDDSNELGCGFVSWASGKEHCSSQRTSAWWCYAEAQVTSGSHEVILLCCWGHLCLCWSVKTRQEQKVLSPGETPVLGIQFENNCLIKTLASSLPLPIYKLMEKSNYFLGFDFLK